ncbi:hypothetical protein [Halegenticoccus tardaugens]|uniref:hypothetical protein n=1 Tax=Halegenticoccus tardaugens TaxID=2071624 RepID=UPI00100AAE44|nr:hypothetical protein [Halegenticoccus tardaugens]
MRRITRNFLIGLALVVVALLALGALPSYLGSGDPYYLTATPTDESGPAIDVTNASERQYPYLTEALESDDGRSEGYQTGRFGFKETFTHSPFDEVDGLLTQNPDARVDGAEGDGSSSDAVLVEYKGERYRVEVTRA